MRKQILYNLLSTEAPYLSGKKLAEQLGISRVAIWKHIEALKQEGYDITGIGGQGYVINHKNSIIIPDVIYSRLSNRLVGTSIIYYPGLDSTNEGLKRLLRQEEVKEGTVIVAGQQSQGKGRLGRAWDSPWGGLWFSFLLLPNIPLKEVALLSLVFAMAIARGLSSFLPAEAMIKWPNDVYVRQQKIAGILLETRGELDIPDYVVVGVGVNINQEKNDFPEAIWETATSLRLQSGKTFDHNEVLIKLLAFLEEYYFNFLTHGFSGLINEYKEMCLHLGSKIQVKYGKRLVSGINLDVDINGSLVVDTGEGRLNITTGDIQILEQREE